MPESVKTAKMSLQVAGLLLIASAVLLLFILITGAFVVGLSGARRALLGNDLIGGVGIILFAAAAALGTACLKAARAISNREKLGRLMGFVLGVLMIPALPFGTVLGIFVVRGLMRREAGTWFFPTAHPNEPRVRRFEPHSRDVP